jgi:hypothetical protein
MRQLETVPRSSATTHTKLVNFKFVNRRILKTPVLASGTPRPWGRMSKSRYFVGAQRHDKGKAVNL